LIDKWATGEAAHAGHQGREGTKEKRAKITRICITKNMQLILNNQIFRLGDDGPSFRGKILPRALENIPLLRRFGVLLREKIFKSDEMVEN
jgi:hypothetical protein